MTFAIAVPALASDDSTKPRENITNIHRGEVQKNGKEKVAEDESENSAIKTINTILGLTLLQGLGLVWLL